MKLIELSKKLYDGLDSSTKDDYPYDLYIVTSKYTYWIGMWGEDKGCRSIWSTLNLIKDYYRR